MLNVIYNSMDMKAICSNVYSTIVQWRQLYFIDKVLLYKIWTLKLYFMKYIYLW